MRERRHRDFPAVANLGDQILGQDLRVREENLVEGGVAVHLLKWLHLNAGLLDLDYEKRHPFVLGRVPVGASEQHPVVGVMGAGRPHLLPVDDPEVAIQLRARRCSGEI